MFANADFQLFPDQPIPPAPVAEPQVLAIDFDDELKAREALLAATRLGKQRTIELEDAAIVTRTAGGRTRIIQTRDRNPGQGAALGFWWAGLAGLIAFGPVGWFGAGFAGAVAGYFWTLWHDIGIDDNWMRRLGATLAPGHSATIVAVGHVFPTNLLRELRRFDGRLLHNTLHDVDSADVEAALDHIP